LENIQELYRLIISMRLVVSNIDIIIYYEANIEPAEVGCG
jgi:hypothetical protein